MGSGKISSSPFSTPSKMPRATDSGAAFGMSKPRVISVSVGPVRTACTVTPCPTKRARSQQRQEGLSHAVRAEAVDAEALFELGTIAQHVVGLQSCVVDAVVAR